MRILSLFFVISIAFSACTIESANSTEEANHSLEGKVMFLNLYDTRVVLIDVEYREEMNAIPPLRINGEKINVTDLYAYIDSRVSSNVRRENEALHLSFDVSNQLNLIKLSELVSKSKSYLSEKGFNIEGKLVIEIRYSSKNDSWLELPPPPPIYN
jgi:hypothetical protein